MKRTICFLFALIIAAASHGADNALAKRIAMLQKLDSITIPEINFRQTPLPEVLARLSDATNSSGEKVNIVLMDPDNTTVLTLALKNTSLRRTLKMVAETSGLVVHIEDDAVLLRKPRQAGPAGGAAPR